MSDSRRSYRMLQSEMQARYVRTLKPQALDIILDAHCGDLELVIFLRVSVPSSARIHTCSISCTLRFSSLYFWRYFIASLWIATDDKYAFDFCLGAGAPGALPLVMVCRWSCNPGAEWSRHVMWGEEVRPRHLFTSEALSHDG